MNYRSRKASSTDTLKELPKKYHPCGKRLKFCKAVGRAKVKNEQWFPLLGFESEVNQTGPLKLMSRGERGA
jgi:hypothetical protein